MLSKLYAAPLHVAPRPSRWLFFYFIFLLVLLMLAVTVAPFPVGVKPVILFAGLFALWFQWLRYGVQKGDRLVREALWKEDGDWELTLGDGQVVNAWLQTPVYCQRYLVVLNFVTDHKDRLSMVLPADTLAEETHRLLRTRIRLEVN